MNRRLLPVLGFSLVLAVTGCGGTTRDSSGGGSSGGSAPQASAGQADPNAALKEGLKISFLPKQVNNPYFTVADGGGKTAVGELKGEYKEVGPSDANASSQVSYINTLS